MANIINVMERYHQIIKDLKNEGLYVDSKIEFFENDDSGERIELMIKADNQPR